MIYKIGRKNFALTVMVPYDCKNACRFCTTKKAYQENPGNSIAVAVQMMNVLKGTDLPIKDVVFTGGEPMENIEMLRSLVKIVPERMNVFINTTLTKRNLKEFIDMVNSEAKIKGVNVSRHGETIEQDEDMLCDIAEDAEIFRIQKAVRINCVKDNQSIEGLVRRWKGTGAELSVRRDFRAPMTQEELHDPYDHTPLALVANGFKFAGKTQCRVCDTALFEKDGFIVRYHKGLKNTAITDDIWHEMEINDLIIWQDGRITYDWENSKDEIMEDILRTSRAAYKGRLVREHFSAEYCGARTTACGGERTEPQTCGGPGC